MAKIVLLSISSLFFLLFPQSMILGSEGLESRLLLQNVSNGQEQCVRVDFLDLIQGQPNPLLTLVWL